MRKTLLLMVLLLIVVLPCVFTKGQNDAGGTAAGAGEFNPTGLPIVQPNTYSFKLFVDDAKADNSFVMLPIFEERTGIRVDLVRSPYTVAQEKLSIALNSGDYADCIGGWTITQNLVLQMGVQEGVFIPLEEYFAKYCPNITRALNRPGVRTAMTAPDGHIYSVPYVLGAPLVAYQPFINTRWLKNLGLKMPTTTAELEAVLKAFKEQDANGNGDPNDEIPFSGDPNNLHLGELGGWFGLSVASARDMNEGLTMVNGQIQFGANTEQYKALIKYLASLNRQGLIDKELFTQAKEQWKAKGIQDKYGVVIFYQSGDFVPLQPGQKSEWEALPVLTAPGVTRPVWLRDSSGTDVLKTQVVVTDKAKKPGAIARWWDFIFDYETSLETQHGPLNVTLFKNSDGTYRKINVLSAEDQTKYGWDNLWPQSLPKYDPDGGYRVQEEIPPYLEKPPADKKYEPYLTDQIPPYWSTEEQAQRLGDMQTSIGPYVKQKRAEWISGQANIDAEWNDYLARLRTLKVDDYVTLRRSLVNK